MNFIELNDCIFNGEYNKADIKLYIKILIQKPLIFNSIITNLNILTEIYGTDYKKGKNTIKNGLKKLKDKGLIDYDVNLDRIKKYDNITINLGEVWGLSSSFIKIDELDFRLTENYKTSEFVLYYLIKRYHDKSTKKINISYRKIEEKTGITNKTVKKIFDKFCEIGILRKTVIGYVYERK